MMKTLAPIGIALIVGLILIGLFDMCHSVAIQVM